MTPIEQRKRKLAGGIFSLFFSWLITVVCFDGILWLGLFVSKVWLPFFVLGFMVVIMIISRSIKSRGNPWCYRMPAAAISTLLISALIMFIINIIIKQGISWEPRWIKPGEVNPHIPYISSLVIYSVASFAAIWYLTIGMRAYVCVHCQIKNGNYNERGIISKLFLQESAIQLRTLLVMSALIATTDWIYYYVRYVNVNYNSADVFFFVGIPTVFTVLTIIYFYSRYNSMWRHYCVNPAMESIHGTSTSLRYIMIVGDHILLDPYNGMIVDTPAKCFIPFVTQVDQHKAEDTFRQLSGIKAPRISLAYESEETATLANTFHYLCFFDSLQDLKGCKLPGQLYSLTRVTKMARKQILSPELRTELERIYTVAMTWKTYTPEGRRIYPVKKYRPSFRLRDIKDYNVDFNDRKWLVINVNNEDKRFFRLRRFWNRHVNGF